MTRLISSQRYLDDDIVAEKIANADYVVTVVTVLDDWAVVIDGHHSLAAARDAGVEPTLVECRDKDTLAGLDEDLGAWLERHWIDSDYYYTDSGELVF